MLNDLIQKIKEGIRLEEYMQESGVDIVSRGSESWKARCWSHPDKNPSVVISIRKGLYHCFSTGCSSSGDVINFHEQYVHVDRRQAIRTLAGRAGVTLPSEVQSEHDKQRHKIIRIMQEATEEFTLQALASSHVKSYLKSRGVSEDVASAFQIGYAKEPLKCASGDTELWRLLELGSTKYTGSLVLPCISPVTGEIAHYVRPLGRSNSKYMGPASSNPSRWTGMMFGLDQARSYAHEKAILVEGQFDCLTLHSYGFRNTVCMLGSHPSVEQFRVLENLHIRHATILFDADPAGQSGADGALRIAPKGVRVSVCVIPRGDPDNFVMQDGRRALQNLLEHALGPADYIINRYKEAINGNADSRAEGLAGAVNDLAGLSKPDFLAGISTLSGMSKLPAELLIDLIRESEKDSVQSIESERQVLAMCVKHPEYIHLLVGIKPTAWILAKHKAIVQRLEDLASKGASEITESLLGKDGAWLFTIEPSNFEYHIQQIKEAHVRRNLLEAGRKLVREAGNTQESIQDIVSMHLLDVSGGASVTGSKIEFTASQVVEDAMEYLHDRLANPDTLPGISLGKGWANITKVTLGLQRNRLYLIGAGPKVGKTSLALNWALACAVERKVPTLWVNLEMSERDLTMRAFSILSGISALRVQSGTLSTKEKEVLDKHAAELYSSPLHILNGFGMTVQEIISVMRKYVYTHAVQLTFIDYIQLLNVSGGNRLDYWERHAMVSTSLKEAINGDLGIPVVALSQLGRPAASEGSSSGSFIGGSYKYIQDCDTFMGLRVRSDKELEDGLGGNLVLNVEYNRHGPQDVYARIHFNKDNLRMEELE